MRSILAVAVAVVLVSVPALAGNNPNRGAVKQACQADVTSLCPGIQPGGGRIKACLKTNKDKLSEGCRSAIAAAMEARRAAKSQSSAAPTGQ